MLRFVFVSLILGVATVPFAAEPKVLDNRLKLELFAEQPQIVTPTGIDVDHLGRVWVIESNTHFPPDGYKGHPTDRVLILEDTDNDGRADKVTTFADGLTHAMSVVVKPIWLELPASGGRQPPDSARDQSRTSSTPAQDAKTGGLRPPLAIFIATRKEILLLRDTNNDLHADERTTLVRLDTPGNYPHNGLAGIAFDALGWMFFGFGENLGADYKLIGSDGVTLSGGGEGGNIYRCRPDGTKLERWATGFWNPHASGFDAFGRLFTVDNDPDSRPPCRLLHIIPGGDYGYRFRNGRKGTHPFTSWNGEIPGTLPMVSGTGEAPSGIICYESDGFPDDYLGTLLVGTWGDHRIDQFVLEPKGASFTSRPKPIVQGDETFRPVGLALAPDGSVFFTDWVLKDYKLHGKGRVWRLSAVKPTKSKFDVARFKDDAPYAMQALKDSKRLSTRRLAARTLTTIPSQSESLRSVLRDKDATSRARVEALWAMSRVSLEVIDFHLGSTEAEKDAPLGGHFDEAMVAIVPLVGTPQFRCSSDGLEFRHIVHPESLTNVPNHLQRQFELARTLRLSESKGQNELIVIGSEIRLQSNAEPCDLDNDPFQLSAEITSSASPADAGDSLVYRMGVTIWVSDHFAKPTTDTSRLVALLAACRMEPKQSSSMVRLGLTDESEKVRRAAVQWVGEERRVEYRWLIEALLNDERTTPDLLLACLATLSLLDGVPASEFEKTPPTAYALAMVTDASKPAALRATALRMLPSATPELPTKLLLEFLQAGDAALQAEAVRTLMQSPRPEAVAALAEIVANPQATLDLRADAILALSAVGPNAPESARIDALLLDGIESRLRLSDPNDREILQLESIRAARNRAMEGTKLREALGKARETANVGSVLREAIDFALAGKNDSGPQPLALDPQPAPTAGRRAFFSPQGAQCAKCHTVHGRGGNVGPDLSVIARTMSREKLYDSIINPSKEISPQFLTWSIATHSGRVHTGLIVTENGGGDLELGDAQGNVIKIPRKEIAERTPSPVSVMPQGLHQRMTAQEFADLLTFLETLK